MRAALVVLLALVACTPEPRSPLKLAPQLTALHVHPSQAQAAPGGPVFDGTLWQLGVSTQPVEYAPALIVGDVLVEVHVSLERSAPELRTSMRIWCIDAVSNMHTPIGDAVDAPEQPGPYVPLHIPKIEIPGGYPLLIDDDTSCALFVRGGGIAGDAVGMATVWVLRP